MKKKALLLLSLPLIASVLLLRGPVDERSASGGIPSEKSLEWANRNAERGDRPFAPGAETQQEPKEDFIRAFASWTESYLDESAEDARSILIEEGIRLAEARRDVMKALIRENPRAAIAAAISPDVREGLPAEVRALLAQPVSGHGDFGVFGIVPSEEYGVPDRLVERAVRLEDARYEAYVYGAWLAVRSVEDVFVHGLAIDHLLAIDESPARILGSREAEDVAAFAAMYSPPQGEEHSEENPQTIVAETASGYMRFCCDAHFAAYSAEPMNWGPLQRQALAAYETIGEKSVLVIRVDFEGEPGESVSEFEAYSVMMDVDRYFQESSYRQFAFRQIHVTAGAPLRMPGSISDYLNPGDEET
ncbi:MAG TPA: hypothetical protein VK041_04595, partial [Opitutales bacterium]|nr:hypothetical protein [Opitutales bacterium]